MTPDSISAELEKDLLSGVFAPGSVLPQGALADRFGVSRIPIRDALAQLARSGLVSLTPNRRARVVKLSREELVEIYDLRLLLEKNLFRQALSKMTDAHLAQIDYALARSNLEARHANWAEGDALFHQTLYAAANRPRQTAMIEGLRRLCRVQIAGYETLPQDTDRWLADHTALRDHCHQASHRKALRRLDQHLIAARDALLEQL